MFWYKCNFNSGFHLKKADIQSIQFPFISVFAFGLGFLVGFGFSVGGVFLPDLFSFWLSQFRGTQTILQNYIKLLKPPCLWNTFQKHILIRFSVLHVKTWKNQSDITETNGFCTIFCSDTRFYDPEAFIRNEMEAPGCAHFCSSNHVLAVQYLSSIPHCIYDPMCFWF